MEVGKHPPSPSKTLGALVDETSQKSEVGSQNSEVACPNVLHSRAGGEVGGRMSEAGGE